MTYGEAYIGMRCLWRYTHCIGLFTCFCVCSCFVAISARSLGHLPGPQNPHGWSITGLGGLLGIFLVVSSLCALYYDLGARVSPRRVECHEAFLHFWRAGVRGLSFYGIALGTWWHLCTSRLSLYLMMPTGTGGLPSVFTTYSCSRTEPGLADDTLTHIMEGSNVAVCFLVLSIDGQSK